MKAIVLVLGLMLAGCASIPDAPELPVKIVEVRVSVPVPCAAAVPLEPAWAMDSVPLEADIDQLMAAALAELYQRAGYEILLKAAIAGCG